jgi:CHASE2 domain-containing sensor protein
VRILRRLDRLRPRETKRFWVALILSVGASQLIDTNWDSLASARGRLGQAVSTVGGTYQQLLTAGPRSTAARYTAIVEIRPGVDPDAVTQNVCTQREYVARVLDLMRGATPSVVVIDKYYSPDACEPNGPETTQLRQALSATIKARIPVIVGRRIDPLTREADASLALGSDKATPIESFVNFHEDTRRLALRWHAVEKGTGRSLDLPTMSLAAASEHRPTLLEESRLRAVFDGRKYPYASFLGPEHFGGYRMSAMELLCGSSPRSASGSRWRDCGGDQELLRRLRGRVVFIGDNRREQDQHPTVIGSLPGVLLHANYVEALLDERVFDGVPRIIELFLGIIMAITLEYATITASGGKQLIFRMLLVSVVALGVSYVAIVVAGRYINPWPISLVALALKAIGKVPEFLRERGSESKTSPAPSRRAGV